MRMRMLAEPEAWPAHHAGALDTRVGQRADDEDGRRWRAEDEMRGAPGKAARGGALALPQPGEEEGAGGCPVRDGGQSHQKGEENVRYYCPPGTRSSDWRRYPTREDAPGCVRAEEDEEATMEACGEESRQDRSNRQHDCPHRVAAHRAALG